MANSVTLNADTLEGQLAELIHIIVEREQNPATNPKGERNIAAQWQTSLGAKIAPRDVCYQKQGLKHKTGLRQ